MNKQEYLVTKLIEEAAEIIQRATKAIDFGFTEVEPTQEHDNEFRLVQEINDFLAVLEMLQESGVSLRGIANPVALAKKKTKVEKFMELSRQQGCLVDEV